MKITLLRHGETAGNIKGAYNGRTDDPLSENGRKQAENAGIFPEVTHVYVSPMLRARQTAEICFPNALQTVIADLREMDFGVFEGRTADEMENDSAYRAWVDNGCKDACPNGESIYSFANRVSTAFAQLMEKGEDAIIVAHGGTIMAILSVFAKEDKDYFQWYVKNCQGYKATWQDGQLVDWEKFEKL